MEDRTAVGETVVGGRRGRAEGMSGREDEAMDGVGKGGGQEGGHGGGGVRWYVSGDGADEGTTGGVASGRG